MGSSLDLSCVSDHDGETRRSDDELSDTTRTGMSALDRRLMAHVGEGAEIGAAACWCGLVELAVDGGIGGAQPAGAAGHGRWARAQGRWAART